MDGNLDDLIKLYKQPKTEKSGRNPFRPLVEESAARHGVDPDFIDAMMGQESAYKPNAKSNKDAHGLMQLIPATAKRFGVTDIYDPQQNIEAGTKYAKWLLDRFDGDVDKALAGYNAGEGAVDKYGGVPPYAETRNYVKKIRSNYTGNGYRQAQAFNSFDEITAAYGGNQSPTTKPSDAAPSFESVADQYKQPTVAASDTYTKPFNPNTKESRVGGKPVLIEPTKPIQPYIEADRAADALAPSVAAPPENKLTPDAYVQSVMDGATAPPTVPRATASNVAPTQSKKPITVRTNPRVTRELSSAVDPTPEQLADAANYTANDGFKIGQNNVVPTPIGAPIEAKNDAEILTRGNAGTVAVDLSRKPKNVSASDYLNREALKQKAANYDISDKEIDDFIKSVPQRTAYDDLTDAEMKTETAVPVSIPYGTINSILQRRNGGNEKEINPALRTAIGLAENPLGGLDKNQSNIAQIRDEEEARERLTVAALKSGINEDGTASLLDPENYKIALNKLFNGEWNNGDFSVTRESRDAIVRENLNALIKESGSARRVEALRKEYDDLDGLQKIIAHGGDFAATIVRFPASFAHTAAWLEDSAGYLRGKIGLPSLTSTDVLNGLDWIYAKSFNLEANPQEQGALPSILAKAIEKGIPDDPRTAQTLAGKLTRAGASAIPFLLGASLSGGSSTVVALLGIGSSSGDLYKQAKEAGLSREKQMLSGLAGIPLGLSELAGLKWAKLGELINNRSKGVFLKSFTSWLAETGKEATEETLQEFFQGAAGDLTVKALKNDGLTKKDIANAVGGNLENALVGGIVGALFGGGVPVAAKLSTLSGKANVPEVQPIKDEKLNEKTNSDIQQPPSPMVENEVLPTAEVSPSEKQPTVPERATTLAAQEAATEDAALPGAVAVLYPNGENVPEIDTNKFFSATTPKGDVVVVNETKLKKKFNDLSLGTYGRGKAERLIGEGKIKTDDLIGGKAKSFENTAGGTSVVSVDESGNELNASKISDNAIADLTKEDLAVADAQSQMDKTRLGENVSTQIVPTQEVAQARTEDRSVIKGVDVAPQRVNRFDVEARPNNVQVKEEKPAGAVSQKIIQIEIENSSSPDEIIVALKRGQYVDNGALDDLYLRYEDQELSKRAFLGEIEKLARSEGYSGIEFDESDNFKNDTLHQIETVKSSEQTDDSAQVEIEKPLEQKIENGVASVGVPPNNPAPTKILTTPKTTGATILNVQGGGSRAFNIAVDDETQIIGYVNGSDFPNQKPSPTRGEVFILKVKDKGKGVGTSLMVDALSLMKANGAETVKFTVPSSEGSPFNQKLIEKGIISEAIQVAPSGTVEYKILVDRDGNMPESEKESIPEPAQTAAEKPTPKPKPKRTGERANPSKHSLSAFVALTGGIDPDGVIDVAPLRSGDKTKTGKPKSLKYKIFPLIRTGGRSAESVFQDAVEAGYMTGYNTEYDVGKRGQRSDSSDFRVSDFIELVAADANGSKHYSAENQDWQELERELETTDEVLMTEAEKIFRFLEKEEVKNVLRKLENNETLTDKEAQDYYEIAKYESDIERSVAEKLYAQAVESGSETRLSAQTISESDSERLADGLEDSQSIYAEELDESEPDEVSDDDLSFDFADEESAPTDSSAAEPTQKSAPIYDVFGIKIGTIPDNIQKRISSAVKTVNKFNREVFNVLKDAEIETGARKSELADFKRAQAYIDENRVEIYNAYSKIREFRNSPGGKEVNANVFLNELGFDAHLIDALDRGDFDAEKVQYIYREMRETEKSALSKPIESPKPQTSFDQTDLFGNKVSAKVEQVDLFGNNESESADTLKKELTDAYGKKTADYISSLEKSTDKNISKVAREMADAAKLVSAKGEAAQSIVETAADALDLFTLAANQGNTVAEQLSQRRLDAVNYTDEAVRFAEFMEAGKFAPVFRSALSEAKSDSILKRVRDPETNAQLTDTLPTAKFHELVDAGIETSMNETGDVELSPAAAEVLRRAAADVYLDKHGIETDEQMIAGGLLYGSNLRNIVAKLQSKYDEALETGYTKTELKGLKDLADNINKAASEHENTAAVYVFDDALPEEKFHQEDVKLGRTDAEAIERLQESTLWNTGTRFEREYENASDADKASEIAAKLATNQEKLYGWQTRDNFAAEKAKFLETFAAGIIRKNRARIEKTGIAEFRKQFERITQYAEITENNAESSQSAPIETDGNESVRGLDRATGEKDESRAESENRANQSPDNRTAPESGLKERSLPKTASSQGILDESNLSDAGRFYESTRRDAKALEAQKLINEIGLDAAYQQANAPVDTPSAQHTALRMAVLEALNAEIERHETTNPERAKAYLAKSVQLANNFAIDSTELGQAISQIGRWSKFDPEAIGAFVQTKLAREGKADSVSVEELKILRENAKELATIADENAKLLERVARLVADKSNLNAKVRRLKDEKPSKVKLQPTRELSRKLAASFETSLPKTFEGLKDYFGSLNEAMLKMVAYHGSPHRFEKFDIKHLGSGEGAQAYGHGLYFTDSESVADYYKETLAKGSTIVTADGEPIVNSRSPLEYDRALNHAQTEFSYFKGDAQKAIAQVESDREQNTELSPRYYNDTINYLKDFEAKGYKVIEDKGVKYKVDLKPESDQFLLWDKPLNKQSLNIARILKDSGLQKLHRDFQNDYTASLSSKGKNGEHLYHALVDLKGGKKEASDFLHSKGIRGIKYLDGTSRNKKSGSYNYVIFDDADIEIQEILKSVATASDPFNSKYKLSDFGDAGKGLTDLAVYKYLQGKATGEVFSYKDWKSAVTNALGEQNIDAAKIDNHWRQLHAAAIESAKKLVRANRIDAVKAAYELTTDAEAETKLAEIQANASVLLEVAGEHQRLAAEINGRTDSGETSKERENRIISQILLSDENNVLTRDDVARATDYEKFIQTEIKAGKTSKQAVAKYLDAVEVLLEARQQTTKLRDLKQTQDVLRTPLPTDEDIAKAKREITERRRMQNEKTRNLEALINRILKRPATKREKLLNYYMRLNRAGETLLTGALQTATHNLVAQNLTVGMQEIEAAIELSIVKAQAKLGLNILGKSEFGIPEQTRYRDIARSSMEIAKGFSKTEMLKSYRDGEAGAFASVLAGLNHQINATESLFAYHPDLFDQMMGKFSFGDLNKLVDGLESETTIPEKAVRGLERYTELALAFNTFQEKHIRASVAKAIIYADLKAQGIDLNELQNGGDTSALPREVLERAVSEALGATFGNDITSDYLRSTSQMMSHIPFVINPMLFRRFFFSSVKFTYQHTPLYIAEMGINPDKRNAKEIAKVVNGMAMFALANALVFAFGSDDDDPDVLVFPNPLGEKVVLRITPYNPLTTFIVMANILKRYSKGKRLFRETADATKLFGYDGRYPQPFFELTKAITGLVGGDSKASDKFWRTGQVIAGKGIAAYLQPFKTFADAASQFFETEAIERDYADSPFFGEIKKKIPFSETISEAVTGTETPYKEDVRTGEKLRKKLPLLNQLGFTVLRNSETGANLSPAAEYAEDLARNKFKSEKFKTPEERRASFKTFQMFEAIDKGELKQERIDYYENSGQITAKQAEYLRAAMSAATPLERKIGRLDESDLKAVQMLASEAEFDVLQKAIDKKAGKKEKSNAKESDKVKVDNLVEQNRSNPNKREVASELNKMVKDKQLTKKQSVEIAKRIAKGDDVYAIESGSAKEAVEAFERGMKGSGNREKLVRALEAKYKRAESAESKQKYRDAAKVYGADFEKSKDERNKIRPFVYEDIDPKFQLEFDPGWAYGSKTDQIIEKSGKTATDKRNQTNQLGKEIAQRNTPLNSYRQSQNVEDVREGVESPFEKKKRQWIDWLTKPDVRVSTERKQEESPELKAARKKAAREYEMEQNKKTRLEYEKNTASLTYESESGKLKKADDVQTIIEIIDNAPEKVYGKLMNLAKQKAKNASTAATRRRYQEAIDYFRE